MRLFAALAMALLATPALAAPWTSGFNMGTFAAVGGGDGEGTLNLECAPEATPFVPAGILYLRFQPGSNFGHKAKTPPPYLTFLVNDKAIDIPVEPEEGSTALVYFPEAETQNVTIELVDQMMVGERVEVVVDGTALGNISLEGSSDALAPIAECLMPGDTGQG